MKRNETNETKRNETISLPKLSPSASNAVRRIRDGFAARFLASRGPVLQFLPMILLSRFPFSFLRCALKMIEMNNHETWDEQ